MASLSEGVKVISTGKGGIDAMKRRNPTRTKKQVRSTDGKGYPVYKRKVKPMDLVGSPPCITIAQGIES